jgi:hypothetical protein
MKRWEMYIRWRSKMLEDGSMIQMFGVVFKRRKEKKIKRRGYKVWTS